MRRWEDAAARAKEEQRRTRLGFEWGLTNVILRALANARDEISKEKDVKRLGSSWVGQARCKGRTMKNKARVRVGLAVKVQRKKEERCKGRTTKNKARVRVGLAVKVQRKTEERFRDPMLSAETPHSYPREVKEWVAGTEEGLKEPKATFSACFGAAFIMLHPTN
ncbi:hypothetical protein JHK85_025212 [Glycine max]|nr:hypothetical protein JHK85_025212 [Glycine max]KAG5012449.1 hypothetical protein JHK86_024710 [Glycine max]